MNDKRSKPLVMLNSFQHLHRTSAHYGQEILKQVQDDELGEGITA